MTHTLRTLGRRARGASLVEYGITVGLVSVLAIGSVLALGGEVRSTFVTVEETLASNLASATNGQGAEDPAAVAWAPDPAAVHAFRMTPQASGNRVGAYQGLGTIETLVGEDFGSVHEDDGDGRLWMWVNDSSLRDIGTPAYARCNGGTVREIEGGATFNVSRGGYGYLIRGESITAGETYECEVFPRGVTPST